MPAQEPPLPARPSTWYSPTVHSLHADSHRCCREPTELQQAAAGAAAGKKVSKWNDIPAGMTNTRPGTCWCNRMRLHSPPPGVNMHAVKCAPSAGACSALWGSNTGGNISHMRSSGVAHARSPPAVPKMGSSPRASTQEKVVPRTSPVSRMPWLSRNCLTFTSCTAAGGGGGWTRITQHHAQQLVPIHQSRTV